MRSRLQQTPGLLLVALLHVGAAVIVLCATDGGLEAAVSRGDTASYLPPAHRRPPLYPLLLQTLGLRGTVVLQLALSLGLAALTQRLLARAAPDVSRWATAAAVAFTGVATLGLALAALSDLVAAALFAGGCAALLFGRGGASVATFALALAGAALTRPIYALAPLCLPALFAVRSALGAPRAPRLMAAASLAAVLAVAGATAASLAARPDQRALVAVNLTQLRARATHGGPPTDADRRLTRARGAVGALLDEARAAPLAVAGALVDSVARVLLAPVEGVAAALGATARWPSIAWSLPLLLLAYRPPRAPPARAVYRLGLSVLLFLVLPAALAPRQGERMRAPALPWLAVSLACALDRRDTRRAALDDRGTAR